MEAFLVYLLKSSGIIVLFLLFYVLFLKRETFFRTNRIYLLSGLGLAIIVPFLVFTRIVWLPPGTMYQIQVPNQLGVAPVMTDSIDWTFWILYGYCAGVFLFAVRFIVQLLSLNQLIGSGKKIGEGKFIKVETNQKNSPFSFFNYLVYNPTLNNSSELKTILDHEKVHSGGRHSLDMLLMQLFIIFQWCNPFIWWYRTFLYDNLEYLADIGTVAKNTDRTDYQYLLLQTGLGEKRYPMAMPFFNNSIKKRIIMLNKNRSNRKNSFKYVLMLPLLAVFIFMFNIKTEAQIEPNPNATHSDSPKMGNIQPPSDSWNDYNPVTFDKEHTGDFPNYNVSRNDNLDDPNKILTITKNKLPGIYVSDGDPLYVVDGKEISKTEFDKIDPNSIESISVWKGHRAIDRFGERGKDDVIEVILKKDYLNIPKTNYGDSLKIRRSSSLIIHDSIDGSENIIGKASGIIISPQDSGQLVILDGKEVPYNTIDSLKPEYIESINVWKGEKAIEKYGDKAKNGVIEIVAKKE